MKNQNTFTKDLPSKTTVGDPCILILVGRALARSLDVPAGVDAPITTNDAEYVASVSGGVLTVDVRPNPFRLASKSSQFRLGNEKAMRIRHTMSDVQAHIDGVSAQIEHIEREMGIPGTPEDKLIGMQSEVAGANESIGDLTKKMTVLGEELAEVEAEIEAANAIDLIEPYTVTIPLNQAALTY